LYVNLRHCVLSIKVHHYRLSALMDSPIKYRLIFIN